MSKPGLSLAELWRRVELGTANEQEKVDAACLAGDERDLGSVPQLLRLLRDGDGEVRYYALQSLVLDLQKTDAGMEERCWKLLREDPDDYVRSMAATCLGKIHFASMSDEPFQRLMAELKSPLQPGLAKGAIYSALFEVAARQPSEWPGLQGPRRVFEESDIEWEKLAQFEDEIRTGRQG